MRWEYLQIDDTTCGWFTMSRSCSSIDMARILYTHSLPRFSTLPVSELHDFATPFYMLRDCCELIDYILALRGHHEPPHRCQEE